MAATSALECFPEGRLLVTAPTLDLLVQTAQAWRAVGHATPPPPSGCRRRRCGAGAWPC